MRPSNGKKGRHVSTTLLGPVGNHRRLGPSHQEDYARDPCQCGRVPISIVTGQDGCDPRPCQWRTVAAGSWGRLARARVQGIRNSISTGWRTDAAATGGSPDHTINVDTGPGNL